MRKINKTIALVLSATMVASLGTGCDKKTDKTKVETQSEQTSETVDDKEKKKITLDGFKTVKTFDFDSEYTEIKLVKDKFTLYIGDDKNISDSEKTALYSIIDGHMIWEYTELYIEILSNGCVYNHEYKYLYSKNMELISEDVIEAKDYNDDYIIAKMLGKGDYEYRLYDSDGKVVSKSDNKYDLLKEVKKEEKTESSKEQNNCHLHKNTSKKQYELYNADGKIIKTFDFDAAALEDPYKVFTEIDEKYVLIGREFGNKKIYIVDLESGETKEVEIKCDNDLLVGSSITYYEEINAFEVYCSYADSGVFEFERLYYDLDGNEIFKNSDGIKVRAYLGNGYFSFSKDKRLGIGLLNSFPGVKATD